MSKKIRRLRALCEADPSNAFGWYSLAIAMRATDAHGALTLFKKVHAEFGEYLPNYYHYAQALVDDADTEGAATIYEQGRALAKKAGDDHTYSELEAAFDLIK